MISRLRPLPEPRRLAQMYQVPHDHRRWPDHLLRVEVTLALTNWLAGPVRAAADLSAGNGWLLDHVESAEKLYGDYAANVPGWLRGPIEQTIEQIPQVDLLLCCETLEHLDDPAGVLRQIRPKTRLLVLSTPVEAWRDNNPEHLWAWDREGVEELLTGASFEVVAYATSDTRPSRHTSYKFGIWGCR